jgi:hypothetical protein
MSCEAVIVPMPRAEQLTRNWHRRRPFSRHSTLLYDFLCHKDMYSCNFEFKQKVDYTYSKNNIASYIDHVFFSKYCHDKIVDCSILCDMSDVVSDHLPLQTTVSIDVCNEPQEKIPARFATRYPRIDWSDDNQCRQYVHHISRLATTDLPDINITGVVDLEVAKCYVNTMCDAMQRVVHSAVSQMQEQRPGVRHGKHHMKHWWTSDCLQARDKQRFWHHIWTSAGRPRVGQLYSCYKLAKKAYRHVCRIAVNSTTQMPYRQLNFYLGTRSLNKFWNLVRRSKCTSGSSVSDIKLDTLHDYYSDRFCSDTGDGSDVIRKAEASVTAKYSALKDKVDNSYTMRESDLLQYVEKLRTGCAAGIDGITAEHIKWAKDTELITVICNMLTLCIRFGIVADSFTQGLLIPLLKKPNIDPTIPKHYRPIVISTTFSKILEIHILRECGEHEFHDLQFGFVGNRGTAMAAALTQDILDYCMNNKCPVYVCALDAEAAFDGIPHAIMFSKAIGIVPELCWRILVFWYSKLIVYIKWGESISEAVQIRKGTRQGGLSSPFIFNLLYQDLVDILSKKDCGISINNVTYNLCCYADDLLLCSLSVPGLQTLIGDANEYITKHGLRFNPSKTKCVTFGQSPFQHKRWFLEGIRLEEDDHVTHLGVILANDAHSHTTNRIKATRRAFYALRGAGLCFYTYSILLSVLYWYMV